jgi:hypothetical protein
MLGDLLHDTSQKTLLAQTDRSARKSVSKVKLIEWSNSRVEQQFSRGEWFLGEEDVSLLLNQSRVTSFVWTASRLSPVGERPSTKSVAELAGLGI